MTNIQSLFLVFIPLHTLCTTRPMSETQHRRLCVVLFRPKSLINKWRANTKPTPINTPLCEGLKRSIYPSVWSKPITKPFLSFSGLWSDSEIWHNTISVNLMLIQCRPSCILPFYIVRLLSLTVYAHIHKQFHINTTGG